MPNIFKSWIVETSWLAEHIDAPDLVVLDASSHLPTTKRNAKAEFTAEHIPGAQFFDIDDISDETSNLPHMLPSTVKFASRMKKMGIGDGLRVIVYDSVGIGQAPRAWWMFRIMGHTDVAVLNGGLKKWKAEGRDIDSGPPIRRSERHFTPRFDAGLVRDVSDMKVHVAKKDIQILDARAASRYAGEEKEFRAGLRSGHIPGSYNLPYVKLITPEGTLRPEPELREAFEQSGIDLGGPIVTTCGSGVTACVLALALSQLGRGDVPIYDGSWSEWGREDNGLPVATGPRP